MEDNNTPPEPSQPSQPSLMHNHNRLQSSYNEVVWLGHRTAVWSMMTPFYHLTFRPSAVVATPVDYNDFLRYIGTTSELDTQLTNKISQYSYHYKKVLKKRILDKRKELTEDT